MLRNDKLREKLEDVRGRDAKALSPAVRAHRRLLADQKEVARMVRKEELAGKNEAEALDVTKRARACRYCNNSFNNFAGQI